MRPLSFLFALLFAAPALAADMPAATPLFAATLHDLDDKPAALAPYKGRPLVVNFWARWCGPCRKEIPELIKARARHQARGVEVLGIGLEDKVDAVRDFAKAYEIDYPVLLAKDKGIELLLALGNAKAGLPYTLAIDRHGRVVYVKLGGMTAADVEAAFAAALER